MKVFVAGATGVIGRALTPRLIDAGHSVTGLTRSTQRARELEEIGVEPVIADAYDISALKNAVERAQAEVVVHQLTALPREIDPRKVARQLADNDRIRVEGTRNLVAAAIEAGARRIVAQSISFAYEPTGGPVKTERDPLWLDAPPAWRRTVEAVASLESQVTGAAGLEGVVLRYGYFYGPGSAYATDGAIAGRVRKRQLPIAGKGSGVSSFIHVDDAAAATLHVLDRGSPGIYNIVDDEPAPMRDWLPVYAEALGARRPFRVPGWLARLAGGSYGHYYMTKQRGASNEKAKTRLGWSPTVSSWRTGFAELRPAG